MQLFFAKEGGEWQGAISMDWLLHGPANARARLLPILPFRRRGELIRVHRRRQSRGAAKRIACSSHETRKPPLPELMYADDDDHDDEQRERQTYVDPHRCACRDALPSAHGASRLLGARGLLCAPITKPVGQDGPVGQREAV